MNLSLLGLDERAFPILAQVRRLSFLVSVVIWLWALWFYGPPASSPAAANLQEPGGSSGPLEATLEAVSRAARTPKPGDPER